MKGRTLVIGMGNPLRGDDALGWAVAERLSVEMADELVAIRTVHQLTPELAEPMSEADLVIFVDASVEGVPGTWKCEEVVAGSLSPDLFEHNFEVGRLLEYAETLFQARPRALLISVTAQSFDCGDGLSPVVEAALPQVLRHIRDQISFPMNELASAR